jgi:hypothetical protein
MIEQLYRTANHLSTLMKTEILTSIHSPIFQSIVGHFAMAISYQGQLLYCMMVRVSKIESFESNARKRLVAWSDAHRYPNQNCVKVSYIT